MNNIAQTWTQTRIEHMALVKVAMVVLFAVATGLAAYVRIPLPFTPVPITLQTLVVCGSGVMLGSYGAYAMLLYLVLGGVGLPFFASGLPGLQAFFGPTGGYLLGFVLCSFAIGHLLRPKWSELGFAKRFMWMTLASLLIFVPGVLQLAYFANIGLAKALALGFYPFIIGDLIKCLAASAIPKRFQL